VRQPQPENAGVAAQPQGIILYGRRLFVLFARGLCLGLLFLFAVMAVVVGERLGDLFLAQLAFVVAL
jgi:hypothetical protein